MIVFQHLITAWLTVNEPNHSDTLYTFSCMRVINHSSVLQTHIAYKLNHGCCNLTVIHISHYWFYLYISCSTTWERTTWNSIKCVKLQNNLPKCFACWFAERHSRLKVYTNQYAMAKNQLPFHKVSPFTPSWHYLWLCPSNCRSIQWLWLSQTGHNWGNCVVEGQKMEEEDISAAFSQG